MKLTLNSRSRSNICLAAWQTCFPTSHWRSQHTYNVQKKYPNVIGEVLLKKCVYPCDFMDEESNLALPSLPGHDEFYSTLSETDYSDDEYRCAPRAWQEFGWKNIWDYTYAYQVMNVMQLADVFERYWQLWKKNHGPNPVHYLTAPSFMWDAALQFTKVSLQLLDNVDKLNDFIEGIHWDMMFTNFHHVGAHNPEVGEKYDPSKLECSLVSINGNKGIKKKGISSVKSYSKTGFSKCRKKS